VKEPLAGAGGLQVGPSSPAACKNENLSIFSRPRLVFSHDDETAVTEPFTAFPRLSLLEQVEPQRVGVTTLPCCSEARRYDGADDRRTNRPHVDSDVRRAESVPATRW